ncbi:MAG: hypothetical protein U5K30_13145 [Acidimicrobiales bacterium]|nr:hypothetical protein [Acidimicrobiales bacterium]
MVLVAFGITAVAAVAALVLGSSSGYSAVRNSQNAADAAATAATATLHEVYSEGENPSEVLSTAVAVAEDNGADAGSVTCEIVDPDYALTNAEADVIGPCDGTNETHAEAAGVRVSLEETRSVPFGGVVGEEQITADAVAAATMQPIREGAAPFMVCANATGHPVPLLHSLDSPWAINEAAVGTSVVVWGNAMKNDGRDCGNPSASWRGLVAFEGSWQVPPAHSSASQDDDWWQVKTGNSSGHLPRLLAGANACGGGGAPQDALDLIDCELILPLCTHGNGQGGSNFRMHCTRLGAFEITYNSKGGGSSGDAPCMSGGPNNLICATFLGAAVAAEGDAVVGTPLPDEVVAIRLVE